MNKKFDLVAVKGNKADQLTTLVMVVIVFLPPLAPAALFHFGNFIPDWDNSGRIAFTGFLPIATWLFWVPIVYMTVLKKIFVHDGIPDPFER